MTTEREELYMADWFPRATAWATLLCSLAASLYLASVSTYATDSARIDSHGWTEYSTGGGATLTQVNGMRVYVYFVLLVLIAAVPLLSRRTRLARIASGVSAGLLGLFVLLGMASIGGAYLPAAMFALLTALTIGPHRARAGSPRV
jgi:hypothetical protein